MPAVEPRGWNQLPGGLVAVLASSMLLLVALVEAYQTGQLGQVSAWALVVLSVSAAMVTRRGDRSLAIMTPPLSFLLSVMVAGQLTLQVPYDWRTAQPLLIVNTLGANAPFVIGATLAAAAVVGLRRLWESRQEKEATKRALAATQSRRARLEEPSPSPAGRSPAGRR
ncbi:MAG: DUF6542 domain-containing protein [Candidatus Nanopelagicales bacterium]